ncbi:alpha/beta hydrolase [Sinomonas albida]|uniref:alpha/beta fold hydrolase n=1 Tax=Sinomonas albida TaxID=369942 RepID=UPI0030191C96
MEQADAPTQRGLPVPTDLKRVTVHGSELAYRERGTGTPVVFVHGGISDLTVWDPTIDVIGEHFRAIAYSRRYAWPNVDIDEGAKDYMQPHVEDLHRLLLALDAAPAHLVGNSWGAFICLRLAIQHPEAVRSLVLQEPPLIPLITGAPPSPAHILGSLVRHPSTTLATMKFAATGLGPMQKLVKAGKIRPSIDTFARAVLGAAEYAAAPADLKAHMYANAGTHIAQAVADGGFEPLSDQDVARVTHPTLVMTGSLSPAVLRLLAQRLDELLPHSRIVDIPDASHVMHIQNPAAANAAIRDFLRP